MKTFLFSKSRRSGENGKKFNGSGVHFSTLALVFAALLVTSWANAADPYEEIAAFSSLKLDRKKIEKGDIISGRSPGMSFARGQSIESVFIVAAPFEKTYEALRGWNGTTHSGLKVYLHSEYGPSVSISDFSKLASSPSNSSIRALVAATAKLPGNSAGLQLSDAEADRAPKGMETAGGGLSAPMVAFWSAVLEARAKAYVGGGLPAEPTFQSGSQKLNAKDEVASLLAVQPKLKNQFKKILDHSGLTGKPSGKPSLYWELFDTEGVGTISLGASFFETTGGGGQSTDLQYYATGGFNAFLTLFQLWPVQVDGKTATLVWRGDLVSATSLAALHGIERNAAGSAMAKEIQQFISHFQKDAAGR